MFDPIPLMREQFQLHGGWTDGFETEAKRLCAEYGLAMALRGASQVRPRLTAWVQANAGRRASHTEIAEEVHAARETVSRVAKALEKEGVIVRHKGVVSSYELAD